MSIFPQIPTDYKTLKNACRKGLTMESRQYWWPVLPLVSKDSEVLEYPDIDGTAQKLVSLVSEYFSGASAGISFDWKTEVLMKSLQKRRGMENPELMSRLVRIISECLPQIEICFLISSDILSKPDRYLQPTALAHGCRLYTFTEVLRRYLPKTFSILDDIGALKPPFLNLMFVDFFRTLLPRQSVLSMLDAYLLEGWRILLRYGLSLIKGYKAQIKARRFATGEDFWQAVQASARSMSASIDTTKVESILQAIKINSFDVERPMIERLYRPMNISSDKIERFMTEGRRHSQNARPGVTTVFESKTAGGQSAYYEPRPSVRADDPTNAQGMSTRNSSDQGDAQAQVYGLVSSNESDENRPLFEHLCQHSGVLLLEDTSRLLQMLPPAVISEGLELSFSTARSGWALGSLYSEVRDLAPSVLLVQTLPQAKPRQTQCNSESNLNVPSPGSRASESSGNDGTSPSAALKQSVDLGESELKDQQSPKPVHAEPDDDEEGTHFGGEDNERGVILGVYLPCPLAPPTTAVRGSGEAFVFRLSDGLTNPDLPALKAAKFPAVLSTKEANLRAQSEPPSSESAAVAQFAVCASSYMSFGASAKHSTNALRIDEELRWVATGPSDTYASPPLLQGAECDANALAGLTMVPVKRGSLTSFNAAPSIRPTRSRSMSGEGAAGSPALSGSSSPGAAVANPTGVMSPAAPAPTPTVFELDRRAEIKQIEVWCGKVSYEVAMKSRGKNSGVVTSAR